MGGCQGTCEHLRKARTNVQKRGMLGLFLRLCVYTANPDWGMAVIGGLRGKVVGPECGWCHFGVSRVPGLRLGAEFYGWRNLMQRWIFKKCYPEMRWGVTQGLGLRGGFCLDTGSLQNGDWSQPRWFWVVAHYCHLVLAQPNCRTSWLSSGCRATSLSKPKMTVELSTPPKISKSL